MDVRPHRPRAWWRDDRGSAAVELTLWAPVLVLMLFFVAILLHRGVDARLRLNDVAHQAARAASMESSAERASSAATTVASEALSLAGLSCRALKVAAAGDLRPGASVTVTVSCEVDFGEAATLLVPTRKWLSSSATEPVDTWRSTGSNA